MDVADAVNVMMWSSSDKNDMPGVAVWDVFKAEDSEKVRAFLYATEARRRHMRVDDIMQIMDDPIHTQRAYLSTTLLAELHETYGVKAFRIFQVRSLFLLSIQLLAL